VVLLWYCTTSPKRYLDLNRTTSIILVVEMETSNQYYIPENLELEWIRAHSSGTETIVIQISCFVTIIFYRHRIIVFSWPCLSMYYLPYQCLTISWSRNSIWPVYAKCSSLTVSTLDCQKVWHHRKVYSLATCERFNIFQLNILLDMPWSVC
jgi:hypothetical protein